MKFKCNIRREVTWCLRWQWRLEPMRLARETEEAEELALRSAGTPWMLMHQKEDWDMSNLQAEMPGECTAVSPQCGGGERSESSVNEGTPSCHQDKKGPLSWHSDSSSIFERWAHIKQALQNLDFKPVCTQSWPKDVFIGVLSYILDVMYNAFKYLAW